MQKVLAICEQVHKDGNIPVAPYLVSLQYLNDEVVEDREISLAKELGIPVVAKTEGTKKDLAASDVIKSSTE